MPSKPFRIVITTTLNNNLFHAKLVPLLRARDDVELVVVGDREGPQWDRVKWTWPTGFMAGMGRLGGRLPLLAREIGNPHTRLVMAYNVLPHGLFAVRLGHLFGKPVYLHYIAGMAEIQFAHNRNVADNRVVLASKNPRRLEKMARKVGKKADHVFVPGSRTEQFLIEQGYRRDRVSRLHSTVDIDRFHPVEQECEYDVLMSAQLRERKRPRFTLQVLREILNRRPQSRFCWLGDGVMHDEFDRMLDEFQLRSHLTWTETDNVAEYYRRAKVFLLCSISEGLSLACMEAMACGMVPVVSDCGDMVDIVRTGQTGDILPMEAPVSEYAEAALKFLANQELFREHSEASTNLIRREHSFETAVTQWQEILGRLVRRM